MLECPGDKPGNAFSGYRLYNVQWKSRKLKALQDKGLPIDAKVLQAGDRLVEKDITERFGMSRTPVRETLKRLEAENLMTYEPRRGLTVTRPTHQMIMELYAMREALEAKAASYSFCIAIGPPCFPYACGNDHEYSRDSHASSSVGALARHDSSQPSIRGAHLVT
ncbi:GntR family transcriptional regulator [Burkholderia cenocepacia]|uniref:GntR family transcriptional regulator n=1 Tax=Burkholderia cenocepacia TaxID=95486 RepID=UPI001F4B9657|nr:GntR family transcriptional regulator [Burkholderia cenocepacia]